MVNVDTHVFVSALAGQISERELQVLEQNRWGISAIVIWEMAKLKQLGRIELDLSDAEFDLTLSNIHMWPLDLEVAIASTRLDVRSDPADELIAATSIVHHIPLLTRDRRLLQSKLIPFA